MRKSLLTEALSLAFAKKDSHPEYRHYIHFSFVVQRNKIVEMGRNNVAEPARHYGYHSRLQTGLPKTHSEVDAYRKARGLLDRGGFEIINIRLSRRGLLRISKPCPHCYEILKSLGCSRFYFSDNIGFSCIL